MFKFSHWILLHTQFNEIFPLPKMIEIKAYAPYVCQGTVATETILNPKPLYI